MTDGYFMQQALLEARKGWGKTHLNPMVGAVIVEEKSIVSRGYHEGYGGPHAEINALSNLGRKPQEGAIMYVTLEPCSSTGKTGPCTQALIESGICKVVIGAIDPDKRHQGAGVEILQAAGIDTTVGVLQDDCEDLNMIFNHLAQTGQPFLAGKTATTLDGKIASRKGDSKWITNEESRADVMRWRCLFPAIAVGAGTVLADDPSLTSRIEGSVGCGMRFVFDRHLKSLSAVTSLKVFNDEFKDRTIIVTVDCMADAVEFEEHGMKVWCLPGETESFWPAFKKRCIQNEISGVFFEGGRGLLSDLVKSQQLDYLFAYRAPKFLADAEAPAFVDGQKRERMDQAYSLGSVRHAVFGADQLIRGSVCYPSL